MFLQITGEGLHESVGTVQGVSEQTGLATVQLLPVTDDKFQPVRYADMVQVPVTRLKAPQSQVSLECYSKNVEKC